MTITTLVYMLLLVPSLSMIVTVDDEVPSDNDKQLGNNLIAILFLCIKVPLNMYVYPESQSRTTRMSTPEGGWNDGYVIQVTSHYKKRNFQLSCYLSGSALTI